MLLVVATNSSLVGLRHGSGSQPVVLVLVVLLAVLLLAQWAATSTWLLLVVCNKKLAVRVAAAVLARYSAALRPGTVPQWWYYLLVRSTAIPQYRPPRTACSSTVPLPLLVQQAGSSGRARRARVEQPSEYWCVLYLQYHAPTDGGGRTVRCCAGTTGALVRARRCTSSSLSLPLRIRSGTAPPHSCPANVRWLMR